MVSILKTIIINFIQSPHTSCSLLCFPWWRILLFCYFVLALHTPRSMRAWSTYKSAYSGRVLSYFFRFWCWLISIFFSSFFSTFSNSIWTLFHPVFLLCVPFCLLRSVSASTRSACVWYVCILIRTYRWSHLFLLSEANMVRVCFSEGMHYLLLYVLLHPEVIFRSSVIGDCPVTTDCVL